MNKTTGIVARLRAPEQWRSFPDPDDDAPLEAAAEIERLRAALTNIIALDAIPRADLGDAVGYAQEALGEL